MKKAEIIEKLKTLREGDCLIGTGSSEYYEEGVKYFVRIDDDGDKHVIDSTGDKEFVNYGEDYDATIVDRVRSGALEFYEVVLPRFFVIDNISRSEGSYEVTITTDDIGFARISEIQSEVHTKQEIARLERQRDDIQRKINELKAGDAK